MTKNEFKVGQIVKYTVEGHIAIGEVTFIQFGNINVVSLWTNGKGVSDSWFIRDFDNYHLSSKEELMLFMLGE